MQTVTNLSDLDLTKEYTYADYLSWKFSDRVELIRGFIKKMSPAPNRRHQTVAKNVTYNLMQYFNYKSCSLYFAPFDVTLPVKSAKKDTTIVQPDICVICDETKLTDAGCHGAPDLIVEILSSQNSKHDVDTKFKLYEESGVKEYWIVEPLEKLVLVYTLQNEKYIGLKPFSEGEIIESPLFSEMKIAVADVFYKV